MFLGDVCVLQEVGIFSEELPEGSYHECLHELPLSQHIEGFLLGGEEDVNVFVGVEMLVAGSLYALCKERVAEVVHGGGIRAEGGEERPSPSRVARLLPEFAFRGGQGIFAFLYAAGADFRGHLSESVAVLSFEDEQPFLGLGDDVDPSRVFEDVVFGMHPAVGQLHLVSACCEPGASDKVFAAEGSPAEMVVVEVHRGSQTLRGQPHAARIFYRFAGRVFMSATA